jgi:transmembrane sensor
MASRRAPAHPGAVADVPAVADVVGEAERRRRVSRTRVERGRFLRSPRVAWALATAAVLVLFVVRLTSDDPVLGPAMLAPIESTASAGDVVTMSLSDGSVVRLAASTTLEFPPSAGEREVVLTGRAFFAVASSDVPFHIRTAHGEVTVHGTRFELLTSEDGLRVVVVEGTVSVRSDDSERDVRAGEVARVDAEGGVRVGREDPWSLLEWSGGVLLFQDTPLSEVAEELGRRFGRRVDVGDGLEGLRVTAWFGDEPVGEVASAVCLIVGATCDVREDVITIGR